MAIRENVLLTCLSKVDFRKNWTNYVYFYSNDHGNEVINKLKDEIKDKDKDKDREEINKIVEKRIGKEIEQKNAIITDGILTNEAPAKIILSLVYKDNLKELNDDKADLPQNKANIKKDGDNVGKLDRIVVLCSDDVQKKIGENSELNDSKFSLDPSKKEKIVANITFFDDPEDKGENVDNIFNNLLDCTHYVYFQKVVKKALKELQKDNENKIEIGKGTIPEFLQVNISNNPGEYDIAKAAIEAANFIIGTDVEGSETKEIYLYIDYNSGPRYIASMLLNTANLLEQRDVTIKNILTMSYENKIGEYVPVESFMGVLQSSRLVSGIKEYLDYGRNKELKKYFENCTDPDIAAILDGMNTLAYNLQTCNTDEIFGGDNILNLEQNLRAYIDKHQEDADNGEGDVFSILFCYVAKDILEGYEPLFRKGKGRKVDNLLDVIDWCRERDYLQQAVTFYAELMPIYFWDEKIYCPTEDEKKEYLQIKKICECFRECVSKAGYKQNNKKILEKLKTSIKNCNSPTKDNSEGTLSKSIINQIVTNLEAITNEDNKQKIDKIVNCLKRDYLNYDWKYSWSQKYIMNSKNEEFEWMASANPDDPNMHLLRKKTGTPKGVSYVGSGSTFKYKNELQNAEEQNDEFLNFVEYLTNDRARSSYVEKSENQTEKKIELLNLLYHYQLVKEQRNLFNHAESETNENNNESKKRWTYGETIKNLYDYIKEIREFQGKGGAISENVSGNC